MSSAPAPTERRSPTPTAAMEPAAAAAAAAVEEEDGWPPPSPPSARADGPPARNWKGRLLLLGCVGIILASIGYAARSLAAGASKGGRQGVGLPAAASSPPPSPSFLPIKAGKDTSVSITPLAADGGVPAMAPKISGSSVQSLQPPAADKQAGLFAPGTTPEEEAEDAAAANGGPPRPIRPPTLAALLGTLPEHPSSNEPDGAIIQDGDVCRPTNVPELRLAVENLTCSMVILPSISDDLGEESEGLDGERGAFTVDDEIIVARRVTIQGNSIVLPRIDCAVTSAERCFRVVAGGFLELRYVRMLPGSGRMFYRFDPSVEVPDDDTETPDYMQMQVVRGGCVLFEPDCEGGFFLGVVFIGDEGTPYEVTNTIELTQSQIAMRIYGGHVFMAGGTLNFVNCMFWDFELLIPLIDRMRIGGDVLILAGTATFTGCLWSCTTLVGVDGGLGLDVAIFGGTAVYSFCHVQIINGVCVTAVAGQNFFVAGGVSVFTGLHVSFFSAIEMFDGAGAFTVLGGVLIQTGVAIEDNYGMVAGFGVGLDICLVAGVMVTTGRAANQFLGPLYSGLLGGFTYVGAGTYVAIGGNSMSYGCLGTEAGGGGAIYNGGGIAVFVGHPTMAFNGVWASLLFGGLICIPAGVLVWHSSPIVIYSAVEVYYGIGGAVFLGAGTALMGWSPSVVASAVINENRDFWIAGSCEPYQMAWAPGPLKIYGLPFTPRCIQPEDEEERRDGGEPPVEGQDAAAAVAVVATAGANGTVARPRLFKSQLSAQHMRIFSSLAELRSSLEPNASRGNGGGGGGGDGPARSLAESSADVRMALPAPMYEMAQALEERLAAIRASVDDQRAKRAPATFHIAGPMEGFCRVCEVDNLEGPGLAACEQAAVCDDNEQKATAEEEPPGLLNFDYSEAPYTEHFLVMAHVAVTTTNNSSSSSSSSGSSYNSTTTTSASSSSKGGGVDGPALDAALLSVLGRPGGSGAAEDEAVGPDAMYVTAFSAEPDALFADMAPGLTEAATAPFTLRAAERRQWREMQGEEGTVTRRFKAVMVATTRGKARWLVAALGGDPAEERWGAAEVEEEQEQEEGAGDGAADEYPELSSAGLSAALLDRLREGGAASVAGVDAWYDRTLYVPAYNSKSMLTTSTLVNPGGGGGAYSVLAVDPTQPAVPLREMQYRQEYEVRLRGFAPRAKLAVSAVKAAASDEEEAAGEAALERPVTTVAADENGAATVKIRLRPLAFPAGDYSLKALDLASGAFGLSPLYSLSAQPQRRRLYGPIMWI